MCLYSISKQYDSPDNGVKRGYKVLCETHDSDKFILPYMPLRFIRDDNGNPCCILELQTWYNANKKWILSDISREYTSGFHIFTNLEDAIEYRAYYVGSRGVIVEIEYDDVTAIGTQFCGDNKTSLTVVVAGRMKIVGIAAGDKSQCV